MESISERDEAAKERLLKGLDRLLSRPEDRELFGLEPPRSHHGATDRAIIA